MSQPIMGHGGHLFFTDRPEKHRLGKGRSDRRILFSGFRERDENVSANQRLGRPSCFSDQPQKNTNLVEDVEILLPVKFR